MKKFGAILAKFALTCIALAAATFAVLFVGAWSVGVAFVLTFALFMFSGDAGPPGSLIVTVFLVGLIIGAMIGIGMILIDPEKARRWGDR
jgi:hypothetical protein